MQFIVAYLSETVMSRPIHAVPHQNTADDKQRLSRSSQVP